MHELIKLRRETGSLKPQPQGNGGGHGKLAGMTGWIEARVAPASNMLEESAGTC